MYDSACYPMLSHAPMLNHFPLSISLSLYLSISLWSAMILKSWLTDSGMPHRGYLFLNYYSGYGVRKDGCRADVNFRKALLCLVPLPPPSLSLSIFFSSALNRLTYLYFFLYLFRDKVRIEEQDLISDENNTRDNGSKIHSGTVGRHYGKNFRPNPGQSILYIFSPQFSFFDFPLSLS
jgi:hypothetical protein